MQPTQALPATPVRRREWVVIGFALMLPTIVTYFYFVAFADRSPGLQYGLYTLGKGIQFLLPIGWILLVAPEKLTWSGPRPGGWRLSLGFGAIVFLVAMGLFHCVLKHQPWFPRCVEAVQAKLIAVQCDGKPAFLVMAGFYSLVHSLLEEYYWRWFVFDRLKLLVSFPTAILISSLGFMAHHVIVLAKYFQGLSPMTLLLSICVATGGAYWAWIYHRTKSIWPPWISHTIVDAAIFATGYQMLFTS